MATGVTSIFPEIYNIINKNPNRNNALTTSVRGGSHTPTQSLSEGEPWEIFSLKPIQPPGALSLILWNTNSLYSLASVPLRKQLLVDTLLELHGRVESTTSIITTTSGILAWDTFTATLGTGNKTFTFAGTPNVNGFTLTQANNQAVLRVGSTVNPGTYTLTITVTDAVGAVSTLTKTVVVNTLPTITGNTSVAGTRGYTFNSPTYSAAGGTGNLTFSISTSPAIPGGNVSGIKLSATTGTPTIIVESTTAADTYTVTLRVTDSLTAFSTFTVTLKVNPPVTLTGSLTLSKVYGEELSQL